MQPFFIYYGQTFYKLFVIILYLHLIQNLTTNIMRKLVCLLTGIILLAVTTWAQPSVTLSGKVTDSKEGTGIPGVSITTKGGKVGVKTDGSGDYNITVPTGKTILVFSYIGYNTEERAVGKLSTLDVVLKSTTNDLSEVIVTGYGNRKKSEFAGAVSKVPSKQIEQVPLASFEQILQGRAPGLYIASGSGQPGTAARVNIRGVSSISGGSDPLYVLDGIPIESGVFRSLNPNDFESVDVLKDAAGAGLYGSRGANGVIVITSKKGKTNGKTVFQYRGQGGVSEAPTQRNLEMMNTAQRLEYEEKIIGPALLSPTAINGYPGWDYSPNNPRYQTLSTTQRAAEAILLDSVRAINTYWPDIFFRRGTFKQHELNASGGTQNLSFYTSLSAYQQEGTIIRSNLDRYTFRANLDFKTEKLTVSVRSSAGWSSSSGIESEAGVALANPIAVAYLELPYRRLTTSGTSVTDVGTGKTGPNAYDRLFTTTNVSNQFKGNLGVTAIYQIGAGFGLRSTNGIDWRTNNGSRFVNPNSFVGRGAAPSNQGSYSENNLENLQLISTSGITYGKTFGDKHVVNVQAMMEIIRNRFRSHNGVGFGLNLRLPNTPAAITQGTATNGFLGTFSGGKTLSGIFSTFAIADYTYDKRYSVTASIRRDAPSQVPEKNRNNIFWTAGGSWNVIAEKFMETQNIFSDLRIRGSYGEAGNINGFNSDFGYISTYGAGSYAGIPGIVPTSPGNVDYKLESQVIGNIGLDFSLLRNRIRATVEVYKKTSQNLFANQNLSRQTGFLALSINAGEMYNKGVEFSLAGDVFAKKDILVTVGVNGAFNQNKVTSLGGLTEIPQGTGIIRVGLPLGTHYTVGWAGVDPATGNPIYQDVNGNPTSVYSASNNRATFGTFLPKFTGGANLDVQFKGFDLGVLFSTAQGVKRFNNEKFFYETTNSNVQFNKRVEMLTKSWTKANDVTDFQRVGTQRQFSSKDIQDASFVRFRNLQFGYTFTAKNIKIIRGFRVWGQAQNLYTWTKWQGFDPEESNNIATYEFPNPRTYTFGLDINF